MKSGPAQARASRILFALVVALLLLIIGRNFTRRLGPRNDAPRMYFWTVPLLRETLIARAMRAGNAPAVRALLRAPAAAGAAAPDLTPLEMAAIANDESAIRDLLAKGADPKGYRFASIISLAIRNMPAVVPTLVEHGADVNSDEANLVDDCPLCTAIRYHNAGLTRYLLSHGARVNRRPTVTPGPPGAVIGMGGGVEELLPASPLGTAACYAPDQVAMLLSRGAKLGPDRDTILPEAVGRNRLDLVPRLLKLGANVNGIGPTGRTSLAELVMRNAPLSTVNYLLAEGADPNIAARSGRTPLAQAAINGNAAMVRLLVNHGADVNLSTPTGHPAIFYASRHHYADIVALLRKAGAADQP
jgi:ankyrin repeat protein